MNNWFDKKPSKQTNASNPADSIVDRFFTKQQGGMPHPLDDASLTVASAQNNIGDQNYNGLCQQFVEQQTYGKTGLYPTAADAWNAYVQEGKAKGGDIANAPNGALLYFQPDSTNFGDGHAAISDGKGNMISATSQGVQQTPISEWIQTTGQKPLGFVIP